MRELLEWQKKLQPDILEIMGKRYRILQYLRLMQPVGRRTLAVSLDLSERVLRTEVTFLKNQGLITIHPSGMTLSDEGEELLEGMEAAMKIAFGLEDLEKQVAEVLNVEKVIVVSGDSDEYSWVKKELGRACVQQMEKQIVSGDIIAVAGGTTLAAVAEMVSPSEKWKNAVFVPARGGLGEKVEIQSNTISSTMATKARAAYRLLHVPDQLSSETRASLSLEPGIKELLVLIRKAKIVIHGIGEAEIMADRRETSSSAVQQIKEKAAVGEAFGYYFDREGHIVHKERTIGLQLNELNEAQTIITVAGGSSKAEAISAYMKYRPSNLLITDEGAAKAILNR